MPKPPEIKAAIQRGLDFLEKNQEADGSFTSFSSASIRPFKRDMSRQTTFVPALILASLACLDGPQAFDIRERLADFLLEQKGVNWAFNYWAKDAPEKKTLPYPDDLDDTFCVLASLHLQDPAIIDGEILAKITKLLLATEVSVGGPYRTWLVSTDSEQVWLDIDVAVNSNVGYFLSLVSRPLPSITTFVDRAIVTDGLRSPYYPSSYPLAYYMARGYSGQQRATLIKIVRKLLSTASTPLDLALSLSALVRLEASGRQGRTVGKLLRLQDSNGAWPAAAFCLDPAVDGKPYYNGAPALTTAFAIEALRLYSQAQHQSSSPAPSRRATGRHQSTRTAVLSLAKRQCRPLPADLRLTTMRALNKLADSSNGTEIISLPQSFNQSLLKPVRPLQDGFLETLSLANLYGWLAYTIYDDFLDEEGKPGLLPAANVAMRNSLNNFLCSLPDNRQFHSLVRQVFDMIDGANAWELAHCRYERQKGDIVIRKLPDYGDLSKLAERSLGHTLAPIAILFTKKLGSNSPALQQTRLALANYLIVRQLNDDLHDWQADLENGHVTYVVTRILTSLRVGPGNHDLSELFVQARQQFWYKTLPEICREMRGHIDLSRQAIGHAGIFKDTNSIGRLLDGLGASIQDTLAKQGQAENFLKHYKRKAVKL
jgi:hypothetical protein